MEIGLIGQDPSGEPLTAQLRDTGLTVVREAEGDARGAGWVVALPDVAPETRWELNRAICESGRGLVTLEAGSLAGREIPRCGATGAILHADGPCLRCLRKRLEAGNQGEEGGTEPVAVHHRRLLGALLGYWIGTVDGDVKELTGRLWEVPTTERSIHPIPGCPRCQADVADRWNPPDRLTDPADRSLEAALAHAEEAIDERVGLIQTVGEIASYPAPYYLAHVRETGGFSDASAPPQAAGVDSGWNRAFMKALGEGLERYSAAIYRAEWLVAATPQALDNPVKPGEFVRPDDWADLNDAEVEWLPARTLPDGDPCQLPADTCLFPPPTRQVRPAITTGLGLGSSGMEAIRSGLCEVIERDAMMLSWYSTYEPVGLAVPDEPFETLASRVRAEGLSVTPLLLTQDIDVPVVAVAVHREDAWPRFAIGSAAALDTSDAAVRALAEAVQNWIELRDVGPDQADEAEGWIGTYAALPEPAREFIDTTTTVAADQVTVARDAGAEDAVNELLARVEAVDLSTYVAWLTPRDVRELGFEAVRVVVPGAQPLFTTDPYFGDRLEAVPAALGYAPQPNRAPHPFP